LTTAVSSESELELEELDELVLELDSSATCLSLAWAALATSFFWALARVLAAFATLASFLTAFSALFSLFACLAALATTACFTAVVSSLSELELELEELLELDSSGSLP